VFALLGDASLRMLPRGIDEYLERRRGMLAAGAPAPVVTAAPPQQKTAADSRAAQKELQRIERRLDRIGEQESQLHARIAEHATDFERVAALDAELRALTSERDDLELRWLELAEDV
jgi:ATP-binding cassette subfamily F protein uup